MLSRSLNYLALLFVMTMLPSVTLALGQKVPEPELIAAIKKKDAVRAAQLIKDGADANARDDKGKTALMWASDRGYLDVVASLIEKGADVNASSRDGGTALIEATYRGFESIVQLLLQKGADVNAVNNRKDGPLRTAAMRGHTTIVKLLIEEGAEVEPACCWTPTPTPT
jgi:uncharacterized protein